MESTCHSEFGDLEIVFIKSAKNAFLNDEKLRQQWKQLNYLSPPNFQRALEEYQAFEALLRQNGANVYYFPQDDSVGIDSIYCRDAAIATDRGAIICNMGKAARKNEPEVQKRFFKQHYIPIWGEIQSPGTLEGGDVAWLDERTLAVGHSYRSNTAGIAQLKALLKPLKVEVIVVPLPHYKGPSDVFHLMSILSPIDKDLAVVYSPLMPIAFREELLKRGFELVEVIEEEFDSMGCNVLAIAPRKCIMLKGNPKTKAALEKAGCEVWEYQGEEISIKGGGGPSCLTRPLFRSIQELT